MAAQQPRRAADPGDNRVRRMRMASLRNAPPRTFHPRDVRWRAWALACAGLLLAPAAVLAQGQESVASPMGAQASGHPPPLLSQASVTAVPSGRAVAALPIPVAVPEERGNGLVLPGEVRLAAPQLACGDIGDATARRRCETLAAAPTPPAGSRR